MCLDHCEITINYNRFQSRSEISDTKRKAPFGVRDLPIGMQGFETDVPPRYIEWIGRSTTPWLSPGPDVLLHIVDERYQHQGCKLENKRSARDIVS